MGQRQYPEEFLNRLRNESSFIKEGGRTVIMKPIPDVEEKGRLDPRLYAEMELSFQGEGRQAMMAVLQKLGQREGIPDGAFARSAMNGIKSVPITEGIRTDLAEAELDGRNIPVRIYKRKEMEYKNNPILYYIHGGGFWAGRPEVTEEFCRLIAEKSNVIVIQPEYRLAPEHPYPSALDDCYDVLKWIHRSAERLGGDRCNIQIAGDSAGGNLAAVCAVKDRDEGTQMIKAQLLLYPSVNMSAAEDEYFKYTPEAFKADAQQEELVRDIVESLRLTASDNLGFVLKVDQDQMKDPYLSPYFGRMESLPPCLLIYGEFDYLRLEDEAYARKLADAGVPVRQICYSGLSHGFIDRAGVWAQAEDAADEMLEFIKAI